MYYIANTKTSLSFKRKFLFIFHFNSRCVCVIFLLLITQNKLENCVSKETKLAVIINLVFKEILTQYYNYNIRKKMQLD